VSHHHHHHHAPPPFDPDLSRRIMEAQGWVPVAQDGLTHCTGPLCGSRQATRESANWALVNCDTCRQLASPSDLARHPST